MPPPRWRTAQQHMRCEGFMTQARVLAPGGSRADGAACGGVPALPLISYATSVKPAFSYHLKWISVL